MLRISRIISAMLLVLGMMAGVAQAQTQTGTVEGKVVDQQGGVLPGVTATLTGGRGTLNSVSDAEGVYRFVGVTPGIYVLKIDMPGFMPQERLGVAVGIAKTITADFTLSVKGLSETVEVRGGSNVDIKSAAT